MTTTERSTPVNPSGDAFEAGYRRGIAECLRSIADFLRSGPGANWQAVAQLGDLARELEHSDEPFSMPVLLERWTAGQQEAIVAGGESDLFE